MSNYVTPLLLVGCGYMGAEYASVLQALGINFCVAGRSQQSAESFFHRTGICPAAGGLKKYMKDQSVPPQEAIVAVSFESLYPVVKFLLQNGVRRILVEKPGGIHYEQIQELSQMADQAGSQVFIAYNRRFYASVIQAKKCIAEDGGVSSFCFEFTEWAHKISLLDKPAIQLNHWFLGNSTHVIDLAFYLGGMPAVMNAYTAGSLDWYKNASSFSGAGLTVDGVPFAYHADWESAGRWSVEILTKKRKLLLCPLEELRFQQRGSLVVEKMDIEDALDVDYKPGLYRQTSAFLTDASAPLLPLREHVKLCKFYRQIELGTSL
ncbi:Gfo/Idh/MocA family oxidoreductase [Oscillibacter sp. 1-3]|uniref:Gfo/Idh/MocA family oxidoreductase n=1 Tax=Oscillibacter sp. 1-3 TaxID=1235797 RepID=UPI000338892B|nr:Gfo/Idh/MocA family oxidoreductase [Oscillibacter sp. 1-3]EOS66682.1 hypothetical protein C816_00828 [Oscillibacter sp. 1-3]